MREVPTQMGPYPTRVGTLQDEDYIVKNIGAFLLIRTLLAFFYGGVNVLFNFVISSVYLLITLVNKFFLFIFFHNLFQHGCTIYSFCYKFCQDVPYFYKIPSCERHI